MEENKTKIALQSLEKVWQYKECSNYGRAFAHYLVFLELIPSEKKNHENIFSQVLLCWGLKLEARNQIEDLYKCYLQGLHYFPLNVEILNNFGAHLLRLDQEFQAKKYLQLANNLDKNYLPVEKNLATVKLNLVQRWHFQMLNDIKRNKAYFNAINSVIDSNFNKILDIGTGCGLLSLFALNNPHTASIIAIEESLAMFEIAKEIFRVNNIKNVNLINKNSNDLKSGDVTLSNVLITEIFDTALFGEHVLESLIHAHENLLENDCRIIPDHADVYISGIESRELFTKQNFGSFTQNFFASKRLKFTDVYLTNNKSEPYDAEHISNYKHKLLTEPHKFVSVNFNDLEQLKNLYTNKDYIADVNLNFVASGELHAFVIWFDLHLNNETITTNPYCENCCKCWEQAVIYLNRPMHRQIGDEIELKISCVNDKLLVDFSNDLNDESLKVSQDVIKFLNDRNLINVLEDVAQDVIKILNDKNALEEKNVQNVMVLDLFPVPIFALNLALYNAQIFCTTTCDINLIKRLCEINGVSPNNVTCIPEDELFKHLERKNAFDIILFNPISPNGTLNEDFYSNYELFANNLKQNGFFIPQTINLHVEIVESDYINYCSKVSDSNLLGFKIAEHINVYSVDERWMLDTSFAHKKLTNTSSAINIILDDSDPNIISQKIDIVTTGDANAVLYFYGITFLNNMFNTYNSSFYSKASFVLENNLFVSNGDVLNLSIKQHKGLLKITCDK